MSSEVPLLTDDEIISCEMAAECGSWSHDIARNAERLVRAKYAALANAASEPPELPDVEDLAHEITQDCLSFGLSTDTVARYLRSYEKKVRSAIEQAVRAQWASEVERIEFSRTQFIDMVVRSIESLQSERDSAQAEAKALKAAIQRFLAQPDHPFERGMADFSALHQVMKRFAALQPGDSHVE